MTEAAPAERSAWAIPPQALTEWLRLSTLVDTVGTVPCRETDAEAWWPDRKHLDSPSTRMAVHGCWRCPAREACLDFAVAANEREGVWGATLPDERQTMRQTAREAVSDESRAA